jgi:hypothetical protein
VAFGVLSLATPIVTANPGGSAPSASFTVPAGEAVLAVIVQRQNTSATPSLTIGDTAGWAWNEAIPFSTYFSGANPWWSVRCFEAVSDGSANVVTATAGSTGGTLHLALLRFTKDAGTTLSFTNWIQANSTTGDNAFTLPNVPTAGALGIALAYMAGSNTVAAPTGGWTKLYQQNTNGAHVLSYKVGSVPQSFAYSSLNSASIGIGVAIEEVAGGGGISGSASITEGADTAAALATLAIAGAGAPTEGPDTIAATGGLALSGAAAITEGADTAAGTGALAISSTGAATEGADTATAVGAVALSGAASITEGADTAVATGALPITGGATIPEGADTASATGALAIVGTATATEDGDTLAASGSLAAAPGTGSVSAVEGADTVSAAGTLALAGSAAATEGADAAAATGALSIAGAGAGALAEGADTAAAAGQIAIVGGLDTTEGADTVSAVGVSVVPAGPRPATGSRPTSTDYYAGRRPALAYGRRPVATAGGRRRR